MTPNQLYPLEINASTGEPFLRLRNHKNIILTPMRWEDALHMVPLFNDPRVYNWLLRTPFPYALSDAEDWLKNTKPKIDAYLDELKGAQGSEILEVAKGAPVCTLRETKDNGTDTFIGNISMGRCVHGELMNTDSVDFEHADQNIAKNERLEIGDPNIVWTVGDYLAPSHHRRGIMTDALHTLLHDWAIPRMKVNYLLVGAFVGNDGSVGVFQKNGFKKIRTIEEYGLVRGKMRGMHVLEWTAEES